MDGGDLIVDLGDRSAATVAVDTVIDPSANTQLMGLYASNAMLCTQCEAEGFRRITFHPDRPDVLSRYKVRMEGDKATRSEEHTSELQSLMRISSPAFCLKKKKN